MVGGMLLTFIYKGSQGTHILKEADQSEIYAILAICFLDLKCRQISKSTFSSLFFFFPLWYVKLRSCLVLYIITA